MNDTQLKDIRWAINALQSRKPSYDLTNRYYDGEHDLAFASEKFLNHYGRQLRTLKANICPAVVDTISDRLQVTNFKTVAVGDDNQVLTEDRQDVLEKQCAEIWRRNRMNQRSGDIHKTSLKNGDAYVLVWEDENGKARLTYESPSQVAVSYHPEIAGYITRASKWWVEENRVRLNLYYPDRIEKYISKTAIVDNFLPYEAAAFEPIEGDWRIPNQYGKVPMFHFSNNAEIGRSGRSELADIIPLQDSLNKIFCDMMVSSEVNAFPQRYIAGLDAAEFARDADGAIINPFKSSMDATWLLGGGDNTVTAGQFATTEDSQFTNRINTLREQIAIESGIPMHRLVTVQGGFPSGESLKTSEAPLTAKVKDRQIAFGNTWSDVLRFALYIEGNEDVDIEVNWLDTEPRNDAMILQNAVLKATQLGVPLSQVQAELGYDAKQIAAFEEQRANDEAAQRKAFNQGLGAQFGE